MRAARGASVIGAVVDNPWLVFESFVSPRFVWGASLTLWITIVSLFFGILVGLLIALLQESKNRYLNVFAVGYLWLFRGTPALFQIIFVFNVLPQFGITLSNSPAKPPAMPERIKAVRQLRE